MISDFRNTRYCHKLENIGQKKKALSQEIKKKRPTVNNYYNFLNRENSYKRKFIEIYNGKCVYCGVSLKVVPLELFEIDHFIPCSKKKKDAGIIKNLVLSCRTCNHNKLNFLVEKEYNSPLFPDNCVLQNLFYRDEFFYIRVKQGQTPEVNSFYFKLKLGRETARIDYLLMYMIGFAENLPDGKDRCELYHLIEKIREKRNITFVNKV